MKVYFAAPLFSSAERKFNEVLTKKIESLGYKVFLPQRDGAERDREPYKNMSRNKRRKILFEIDRDQILNCDVFLFILDGRVPDEGACVELGIAYAQKLIEKKERIIIGLHTDIRAAFIKSKLNPMLSMSIEEIYEREQELLARLGKSFKK